MAIHNYYLGTELPYCVKMQANCKPPKGYEPIYISHLGRHGSRYLASDRPVMELKMVLDDAMNQGALLQRGYMLRRKVETFSEYVEGRYGLLTPKGALEEQGIARRMYQRFKPIFTKEKTVYADSTYVTRTKESMEAFVQVLRQYAPNLDYKLMSNGKVDPIFRFFDLNTAYLEYKSCGSWQEVVRCFEQRSCIPIIFLRQFFKEHYIETMKDPIRVATDVYDLYANTFNIGINLGFTNYFTDEMLNYFWENENLQNYLLKGPSEVGQNLPSQIAFALLRSFIEEAECALCSGKIAAHLRFAHAETLLPFVTLLDLSGSNKQTDDFKWVAQIWKDYCLAPMGANLQFVFYRNQCNGTILVQLLYNETPYCLPFEPIGSCFYNWEEVKHYYLCLLSNLPIPDEESVVLQVKDFIPCSEAKRHKRHKKYKNKMHESIQEKNSKR